jgi:hypothetical protein
MTAYGPLTGYINFGPDTANSLGKNALFSLSDYYIEWGPILVGYTGSIFNYSHAVSTYQLGSGPVQNKIDQIRFSWASGPIGIQLAAEDYRDRANNAPSGSIPDLVAALTFKSGIVDAKLAAGYGDRVGGLTGGAIPVGYESSSNTWGIMGAIGIDLSTIAKGDRLTVKACYSEGTGEWCEYHSNGGEYAYANSDFGGTNGQTNVGNYTYFGISGKHYLIPSVYLGLSYDSLQGTQGYLHRGIVDVQWEAAKGLNIGAEAVYQDRTLSTVTGSVAALDGWSGRLRLQRNFP